MSAAKFTARFRSVGNPDFGQYAPVSNPQIATADTLGEIVAAWHAYVDEWALGGGNCPAIPIKSGKRVVARISYNGRLWHPTRKRPLSSVYQDTMIDDALSDAEIAALEGKRP